MACVAARPGLASRSRFSAMLGLDRQRQVYSGALVRARRSSSRAASADRRNVGDASTRSGTLLRCDDPALLQDRSPTSTCGRSRWRPGSTGFQAPLVCRVVLALSAPEVSQLEYLLWVHAILRSGPAGAPHRRSSLGTARCARPLAGRPAYQDARPARTSQGGWPVRAIGPHSSGGFGLGLQILRGCDRQRHE